MRKMASNWNGCTVSITCKNGVGVYQGLVSEVNSETQVILLSKPFKNGVPYSEPQVALSAHIIANIEIIEKAEPLVTSDTSTVTVFKSVPKRVHRPVSENIAQLKPGPSLNNSVSKQLTKLLPKSESPRKAPSVADNFQSALFEDTSKKNPRHKWNDRDTACFGEPIKPDHFKKEFDFEKNLALFNKQAVFEQINAKQRPDLVRQTDRSHRGNRFEDTTRYRQQILVPQDGMKEYITDEGITIPSIPASLRDQLFSVGHEMGLSFPRIAEMMGRATAEITISLIGGPHRLNPLSSQQKPLVVVLAGPHRPGAFGINSARQLASQGVDTVVFLSHPTAFEPCVAEELNLFRQTGHNVTNNVYELPPSGVDLVVVALADERTLKVARPVINWASDNKCVLLGVDPPSLGTPGIQVRFSLVPALPLPHSQDNGKLFLVNLAIPLKVFTQLNIRYRSPFGAKFVIPIHPKD